MPEAALFVAQKIRAKIDKGFDVFAHQAKVTASIGISLYPTHGMDAETLLKVADQAMYQAKEKGNACMIFKPPQFPK
jgi:diguanylate cyclase (GGDEF)-like protein